MSSSPETKEPAVAMRYWCFISYSSKDAALSRRLYHALETYRIPRDLVGRPGRDGPVPKKLFPCFRDRDELPLSSNLGATIQDALRASRYLVVICTPNSAASRWVNEEVLCFKGLGRSDRILAIIAAGEPNASDLPGREKEECFCPALRFEVDAQGQLTRERCEPIAGDLRKGGDGWTNSFLKAVAGITGLGFNAFAQREVKRRRRRQALAGLLALAGLAAAFWYWDYTRVKTAYYEDYATHWNVPAGVGRLSEEEVHHRNKSLRIESSRYKVRSVTEINGSGSLVNESAFHNGAGEEIHYRDSGDLDYIAYRNANNQEVFREVYSDLQPKDDGGKRQYIDFKLHAQNAAATLSANAEVLGIDLTQPSAKSEITGEAVDYDKDGLTERVQFRNSSGSPRPNGDGIYGQRFSHSPLGLVTKTENLGPDGQPQPDQRGVVSRLLEFDARGRETAVTFFGADGKPALNGRGFAKNTLNYDSHGNLVEIVHLGLDGKPIVGQDGAARVTVGYDNRGNMISESCTDADGRPSPGVDGPPRLGWKYDDHGHQIEAAYFGADGKPALNKDGVAGYRWKSDERGNIVEEAYFGLDGKPTLNPFKIARGTLKYDDRGNRIEQAGFGADGRPMADNEGVARIVDKYDDRNNLIEQDCLGVDGRPVLNSHGMSVARWTYDDRGNKVEEAYYGIGGQPVTCKSGYARIKWNYDERGNKIEEAYFGVDGQPALDQYKVARETVKYDERGNEIEEAYFGIDGQPAQNPDGIAKLKATYDDHGNRLALTRYAANGKIVPEK